MPEKKSKCSRRSRRSPSPCSTRSATPPPCRKARSVSPPCRKARSPSPKRSPSPPCRKPRSPSPPKYTFTELYDFYKYQLLTDSKLMVAGTDAFAVATNIFSETIAEEHPINLETNFNLCNIDHFNYGAPFHVRKAGTYALFFVITSDNAAQVAVYINGIAQPLSRVGNNSGSGQLRIQMLLDLQVNDGIVVRNSNSSASAIDSNISDGGLENGNPSTILIFRIGINKKDILPESCLELERCQVKLFKKIKKQMLTDQTLMLQGYNIHGSFFTYLDQTIPVNGDIQWDNYTQVTGLTWDPLFPERVLVQETGTYKCLYILNTVRAAQMTLCINGIPELSTTQGVNKGASQVSGRTILALKAGDYITVRNYVSAVGDVNLIENSGGSLPAIAAVLIVFKVAPFVNTPIPIKPTLCLDEEKYLEFRSYLLKHKELTIQGLTNYINLSSDTLLKIPLNAPIDFSILGVKNGITFIPGYTGITIESSGVYLALFDIATAQPIQITMFVNNIPDLLTTSGRDSGGSRLTLAQLVNLKQGDIVDFRNYQSPTALDVSINAGGKLVGNNRKVTLVLLAPEDVNCKHRHMYCKPYVSVKPPKVIKEYIYSA